MQIGPSDDKQPKWLPKKDQDKRSEARRSGELQAEAIISNEDSFQDSLDNSSSFWTEDHMERQEHLTCF